MMVLTSCRLGNSLSSSQFSSFKVLGIPSSCCAICSCCAIPTTEFLLLRIFDFVFFFDFFFFIFPFFSECFILFLTCFRYAISFNSCPLFFLVFFFFFSSSDSICFRSLFFSCSSSFKVLVSFSSSSKII
uniref:Uncharacterized protein n=1 Tax=Cacopsylla melanoneura TaxID=428564 RepID=A0A8D8RMV4_9HEMI